MFQFEMEASVITMCNTLENELHRYRTKGREKQMTLIEWLNK
jgi:hypothetical protein